jgi:putative FmdB family regulatory protein
MPLYEYQCDACSHRFERIQKFSDPPVSICPACGGTVRKLLSSPAIQFKGTGWYITDYAKKGGSGSTSTGSSSSESSGDSGSSADKSAKSTDSSSGSSKTTPSGS